jgi:hypothetical protein
MTLQQAVQPSQPAIGKTLKFHLPIHRSARAERRFAAARVFPL